MPIKQPALVRETEDVNGFGAVSHHPGSFLFSSTLDDDSKEKCVDTSQLYEREINVVVRADNNGSKRNRIDKYSLLATRPRRFVRSYEPVLSCQSFLLPLDRTCLNNLENEARTNSIFLFFSRQLWTADGPDGRHGRCAGAIALTRGGDRATNRHLATAGGLARAGTSMWRIAPAACATVSHRQTFLRLDCVSRSSRSFCVL